MAICGTGDREPLVREEVARANSALGVSAFRVLGWLSQSDLAGIYRKTDLVLASGRGSLEAMSCGCAVITMGSLGYTGIIDGPKIAAAQHVNFGSLQRNIKDLEILYRDFVKFVADPGRAERNGRIGPSIVKTSYDQNDIDRKLLAYYQMLA